MWHDNEDKTTDWEKQALNPNEWNTQDSQERINVVRRMYHQDLLNKDAQYQPRSQSFKHYAKKLFLWYGVRECILNSLPIVRWLPKYQINQYLVGDIVSGATAAVMHIPQGMAYALLSEVPPIVGLYMAFFPVLMYVVFGTSPHVSMGTFAVACLMAGKVVSNLANPMKLGALRNETDVALSDAPHDMPSDYGPIEIVSILCFAVGVIQVTMWVLRLGAVSTLLSDPLVSGFTTGACFHVLITQLKDLLGIRIPKFNGNYKNIFTIVTLVANIPELNWAATIFSLITCTIIALNNELLKPWVSKRSRIPVPIELFAVVMGTVISKLWGMKEKFQISLVSHIPTGLPVPQVPPMELFTTVLLDAFIITMVTYTVTMSLAMVFADKDKYEIDANQELLAMGASNVFGAFFGCVPICASLSRSYIQYQAGCKTCLASVVSAVLILFVLLWIGPFFEDLPRCVLASIIVVSLKNMMMQVVDLKRFWKLSKLDALVWLVTFLITVLINIDVGLLAGLLASVGTLFCRSQKPYTCLLGRVKETDIYLDIKRYRAAEELPGIKIFHFCGGLNFASKSLFRATLYRKIGYLKSQVKAVPDADEDNDTLSRMDSMVRDPTVFNQIHCVILDATALSYVDAPGVKSLVNVHQELSASGLRVLLSGANGPVQEMIETFNSLEKESDQLNVATFPTVHDAVVFYQMLMRKENPNDLSIQIKNDAVPVKND